MGNPRQTICGRQHSSEIIIIIIIIDFLFSCVSLCYQNAYNYWHRQAGSKPTEDKDVRRRPNPISAGRLIYHLWSFILENSRTHMADSIYLYLYKGTVNARIKTLKIMREKVDLIKDYHRIDLITCDYEASSTDGAHEIGGFD